MAATNQNTTRAEPFSTVQSLDVYDDKTDTTYTVEDGQEVDALPKFLRDRVPAEVISIYHDPRGLPGGRFDHRGAKIGRVSEDGPTYERPDEYDCVPTARIRMNVPEGHEYDHLDGKERSVEIWNIPYVLGLREDD